MNVVYVFFGGGIGSAARYVMQGIVYRWLGTGFPYGTLLVNVLGSFLIGLLMTTFEERFLLNPSLRIFLTIGILGGFTTLSSFSYETVMMLRDAEYWNASLNVVMNVFVCFGATYIGVFTGKLI